MGVWGKGGWQGRREPASPESCDDFSGYPGKMRELFSRGRLRLHQFWFFQKFAEEAEYFEAVVMKRLYGAVGRKRNQTE